MKPGRSPTVRQLIRKLRKMPLDAPAKVWIDHYCYRIVRVESAETDMNETRKITYLTCVMDTGFGAG